MTATDSPALDPQRADLLDLLTKHRGLFLATVAGMTDDQARERSTVSELTLGGLVKHVSATEEGWAQFVVEGPAGGAVVDWEAIDWNDPPAAVLAYQDGFRMRDDETLAGLVARYAEVAAATDALVRRVDLDGSQPLPDQPWFEPGSRWTARRTFLHIAVETAQHAGHADIIREAIDGQKTMG